MTSSKRKVRTGGTMVDKNHVHEWVVFSTALSEGWLMVQCVDCGEMGTVEDPSTHEWKRAFHAPSCPYRWHERERVRSRGKARAHVVRRENGAPCDCPEQCQQKQNQPFHRYPAEAGMPKTFLTDEERGELSQLGEMVGGTHLCSRLFPYFIQSFEQDTGQESTGAVKQLARRIKNLDSKGFHFPPWVIARLLNEWAGAFLSGDGAQRAVKSK